MKRIYGTLYFLLFFFIAFFRANIKVAWVILFEDKSKLNSFFFDYETSDLTRKEALFLSQCITLTPGTISVKFSKNLETLLIHVLSEKNPEIVKEGIDNELKKPLLKMTRGI